MESSEQGSQLRRGPGESGGLGLGVGNKDCGCGWAEGLAVRARKKQTNKKPPTTNPEPLNAGNK